MKVWKEEGRPQCPAELHLPYEQLRCHLLFGHEGTHRHFTAEGSELAFATDERPSTWD